MTAIAIYNNQLLIRRPSEDARQYTYRVIKTHILRVFFKPGQKLNELEFANVLQVSRTPVHETFIKLSRESLVEIVQNQGAFVSRLNPKKVEEAIWMHEQLGNYAIQQIFLHPLSDTKFHTLNYLLDRLEDCVKKNEFDHIARIILEFYHQLYSAAGDMNHIWEALKKNDSDFQRLLFFAVGNVFIGQGFLLELRELMKALKENNIDKACSIYSAHLTHISLFLEPTKQYHPEFLYNN